MTTNEGPLPQDRRRSGTNALYVWSFVIRQGTRPNGREYTPISVDQIKNCLVELGTDDWVFQLERGRSGNLHYQGYLRLTVKKRSGYLSRNLSAWSFTPCSSRGKAALRDYCLKSDTRVDGPYGKRRIYMGKDLAIMRDPLPWQQEVIDILAGPPDRRCIYWIVDEHGNKGKSVLTKWLWFRNKKDVAVIPFGTATQIKTSVIAKGPRLIYLLDVSRSLGEGETMQSIFSAIEQIKNGFVLSAMYGKDGIMAFEPPHVICFSNYPPPWKRASRDRWRVFNLSDRNALLEPYRRPDDGQGAHLDTFNAIAAAPPNRQFDAV